MVSDGFKQIQLLKRMNWAMNLAVGVLMVAGVFFIYSASYANDETRAHPQYLKQMVWIAVGICFYLFFAVYDYRKLGKLTPWLYAAALFLLGLVLCVGVTKYGATRWIRLYGEVVIQPSELAKMATLLILAHMMSRTGADLGRMKMMGLLVGLVGVPVVLILKEPDLGTAVIFVPMAAIMMFVGGVPLRVLGGFVAVGGVGVLLILSAVLVPMKMGLNEEAQQKVFRYTGLRDHQRDRIVSFFRPGQDPLNTGWNKMQSEIAIGSGGKWGKGFLKGTQNILGYLPRSVAPTDFVYSVVAEETGFAGSVVVLVFFGVVVVCGMYAAAVSQDKLGCLLCTGVVAVIFCHAFINLAMTVGLLPITGLPLPFLSYGGTFMVVIMSGLGIVQSVHIRSRRVDLFEVV